MDASHRVAIAAGMALVLVHLAVTVSNGFALPEGIRAALGARPETTLTRP